MVPLEVDRHVVDPTGHAIKRDRPFKHEPLGLVGGTGDRA
jgi:hypothetical protein